VFASGGVREKMGIKTDRKRVLFLCTGNSCRSQMAEGWLRHLSGGRFEVHSAGTNPGTMDPKAAKVMAEAGVDISGHWSKGLEELLDLSFDLVVTVCDSAREACPIFPGRGKIIHRSFQDPPLLAKDKTDEEEALGHYRRVRDEIREFIVALDREF
jgi:arsenate reductase